MRTGSVRFALVFAGMLAIQHGMAGACSAGLLTDLQVYYQFNGNGNDSSGNGRNLDLFGGVGFAPGLFGQALDLHRNNSQFAQRPVDDLILNLGPTDFTIQTWVNFNSTDDEQTLIEKYFGSGGPGWTLTKLPDDVIRFSVGPTPPFDLDTPPLSIPTGVWHNVTVRHSGGTFDLFFDGTKAATRTDFPPIQATSMPLLIGKRNDLDGRGFPVDGRIDETAIWTRALSDGELAALYNGGRGMVLTVVPEPSSLTLLGLGLLASLSIGRWRGRRPR
jgi:hypothetical protein